VRLRAESREYLQPHEKKSRLGPNGKEENNGRYYETCRASGRARAAALSDEELSAAGSKAVNARWAKYYQAHPEKLKAKTGEGKEAQVKRVLRRSRVRRGHPAICALHVSRRRCAVRPGAVCAVGLVPLKATI